MTKERFFSFISAVLMILLLLMQFTPFWQVGDGAASVSIQGYVWFPGNHLDLTKELQTQLNDPSFEVGRIVLMPVLELVLCCVGAVFCFAKSNNPLVMLFPAAAGIAGIWGYLEPAFRSGHLWPLHLALSVLLLAAAIIFYGTSALHIKKQREA